MSSDQQSLFGRKKVPVGDAEILGTDSGPVRSSPTMRNGSSIDASFVRLASIAVPYASS